MSYRLWHQHKRQVIVSPPGSQHSSVVLDSGSNKSVRSVEFPFRFFWTCLLTFLFGGLVFFDYVLPWVIGGCK